MKVIKWTASNLWITRLYTITLIHRTSCRVPLHITNTKNVGHLHISLNCASSNKIKSRDEICAPTPRHLLNQLKLVCPRKLSVSLLGIPSYAHNSSKLTSHILLVCSRILDTNPLRIVREGNNLVSPRRVCDLWMRRDYSHRISNCHRLTRHRTRYICDDYSVSKSIATLLLSLRNTINMRVHH